MEPLDLESLPEDALLMVNSAPIIYMLEGHPAFMPRFRPLFDAHAAGRLRFAVTTLAIAEVLIGPLKVGDEASRGVIAPSSNHGGLSLSTAPLRKAPHELRASFKLKLADAVQAASALAVDAAALVTHDRDFSRIRSLRIIS